MAFVEPQDLSTLLRCHLHAFRDTGRVSKTILYDNMTTVVLLRQGSAIEYHPPASGFHAAGRVYASKLFVHAGPPAKGPGGACKGASLTSEAFFHVCSIQCCSTYVLMHTDYGGNMRCAPLGASFSKGVASTVSWHLDYHYPNLNECEAVCTYHSRPFTGLSTQGANTPTHTMVGSTSASVELGRRLSGRVSK